MGPDSIHFNLIVDELRRLQTNIGNFINDSNYVYYVLESNHQLKDSTRNVSALADVQKGFVTNLSAIAAQTYTFNLLLERCNMLQNTFKNRVRSLEQNIAGGTNCKYTTDVANESDKSIKSELKDKIGNSNTSYPKHKWSGYTSDTASSTQLNRSTCKGNESPSRYKEKDISIYHLDDIIAVSITFVKDYDACQFYVCDLNTKVMKALAGLNKIKNLRQYHTIPSTNVIFGLLLQADGIIVRAIRSNETTDGNEKSTYPVLLLEYGEIYEVNDNDLLYYLPTELTTIPAQAILCQLSDIALLKDSDMDKLRDHLKQMVYKSVKLRVVAKCVDKILVNFVGWETTHLDMANINIECKNNSSNDLDFSGYETVISPGPKQKDTINTADDKSAKVEGNKNKYEIENLKTSLTPAELKILFEDEPTTSNAVKAVMGYVPSDQKRICRFYNPKTGGCFKGRHCHLEHTPMHPDGWTKDVQPAAKNVQHNDTVDYFRKNLRYAITPTHIVDLRTFYAQLSDTEINTNLLICDPEDLPVNAKLNRPPYLFEVLLAKYDDNLYYRAKVLECEFTIFRVIYIDYGNEKWCTLNDLAFCDYINANLPPRAHLFTMAGVLPMNEITEEKVKCGKDLIADTILNKTVYIKVISNDNDDIIVKFVEPEYRKLPYELINLMCLQAYK